MPEVYPTLFRRYISSMIDGLFALALFIAIGLLPGEGEFAGRTKFLGFFAVMFWYEPICTAHWCTLGQWLTGIRVRSAGDTDLRIPLWRAVVRFVVKGVLGMVSFFLMPFTERYRAMHDLAASSVVVQVRGAAVEQAAA